MTSVYRQLKTEVCNAKETEHFSVHVLMLKKCFPKSHLESMHSKKMFIIQSIRCIVLIVEKSKKDE